MVLTSGLKKIIGTKAFYKAALAFAIPLILQDTVSSFVNLLDNMMIGSRPHRYLYPAFGNAEKTKTDYCV